jgi:hypothetical protein
MRIDMREPESITPEKQAEHQVSSQIHLVTVAAERELSAFVAAVGELFGAEQARLSAEEWLEELASRDRHSQSNFRDWRLVTIAALARLADRLTH